MNSKERTLQVIRVGFALICMGILVFSINHLELVYAQDRNFEIPTPQIIQTETQESNESELLPDNLEIARLLSNDLVWSGRTGN